MTPVDAIRALQQQMRQFLVDMDWELADLEGDAIKAWADALDPIREALEQQNESRSPDGEGPDKQPGRSHNPDGSEPSDSHPPIREAISAPPETYPIPLNEQQEAEVKSWAADDRLWTTQETVEFNLRVFARKILAARLSVQDEGGDPQT